MEQEQRPVYRHIVVKRLGVINHIERDRLHRLRQWVGGDPATRGPLPPELESLYRADSVARTKAKQLGDDAPKVGAQEGYVVGRIPRNQVPGGYDESLPTMASVLKDEQVDFDGAGGPDAAFLKAAEKLRKEFERISDQKFRLVDEQMRAGCTLVTVAYTPISAYTLPERGFAVGTEFHQVTRFGHVDTEGFEVYSEIGEYPIVPPDRGTLLSMMKTAEEWQVEGPPSWPDDHPIAIAKREIQAKKIAKATGGN